MKPKHHLDILRVPDRITVFGDGDVLELQGIGGRWQARDIVLETMPQDGQMPVVLAAPESSVQSIRLRWQIPLSGEVRVLGDHWERGYGDLEWRGLVPERVLPWYFLFHDGTRTHGCGVRTGGRSLCFWQADPEGVTLWLDVRCGGSSLKLGERRLEAALLVSRDGRDGETPFESAQAFCRSMCPESRLPVHPVYGGNNWYYAYGDSSDTEILDDARRIAGLAPPVANRPFMVIDEGWQMSRFAGPWDRGGRKFPDMPGLAARMRDAGTRPGIWMRPLLTVEALPESWFLPDGRFPLGFDGHVLDPTVPEAAKQIADDVRRLVAWGYDLIKHDFSTFDLLGRWGFAMGADITPGGWHFADRSRTTAEVVLDLYRLLRQAAGDALVLGCNTIGHLAAGLFELQRTGDDTSGRDWERTRRMGVNTLAFRMPQHGSFFAVDADCVGLTRQVPWAGNRQWLDLLARSGTPLFVSAAPDALEAEQKAALTAAFAAAAAPQPVGEALDWLTSTCPARWRLGSEEKHYNWSNNQGASPFAVP